MRILTVNNYHYRRGGSEACYLDFNEVLQQHGHTVINFSTQMPQNLACRWADYFIKEIEYERLSPLGKLGNACKIIYSREARKKIERLLRDTGPQVAHLHNIYHHLSPSILEAIKGHGLPAVMTLHDLKRLCPAYNMLRQGKVCESCGGTKFYRAVLHRCLKGSLALSALIALEMYLHKWWGIYEKNIDVFISPSRFLRNKLLEYGFCADKIVYIPNFVRLERFSPDFAAGDYILYVGRLSPEKGIITLLEAMAELRHLPLKIVGGGPQLEEIEYLIAQRDLSNVQLLGYRGPEELAALYRGAKFVVLPSEWYENAPLAILEAFACGKPVIGADIGGIPELIGSGGEHGLLFTPGRADDLAQKISSLVASGALMREMGKRARKSAQEKFSPKTHYRQMLAVYEKFVTC